MIVKSFHLVANGHLKDLEEGTFSKDIFFGIHKSLCGFLHFNFLLFIFFYYCYYYFFLVLVPRIVSLFFLSLPD